MSTNSELIAEQLMGALEARRIWGDIILNVKLFGARGDGTTDDTGAIRRALNAASLSGGGLVHFPPGTYIISGSISIPSNCAIEGLYGLSVIKLANGVNTSGFPTIGGVKRIVVNSDYTTFTNTNIALRNISFDGNGANQTTDCNIGFIGVKGVLVENCYIHNFGSASIYAQGLVIFGARTSLF
jgi:polygalacturonase